MNNPKTRIFAKNGKHGLDIYLDISGRYCYLTTHRPNGLLYLWLKDGRSIGEIHRHRAATSRARQKTYHYAQYLAKLTEDYLKYDMAA